MSQDADPAYLQAAWSWCEHLRSGGTTTWADWLARGPHDGTPPPGWTVPGAAQLEVVRRASAALPAGHPEPGVVDGLAEVVLSRGGPGRGLGQQPLSWPGRDGRGFGAPPVDPADVSPAELVRVAVGALAELLLRPHDEDAGDVALWHAPPRRRWWTRSPAFRLAGAPITTSAVRRALEAARHVEGGASPEVVVLVEPFDELLAQVWSARVQRGAPVRWHGFVNRWSGRRGLPPSADVVSIARHWADRVGADRVHLVVAPRGTRDAVRTTSQVIGVDAPTRDVFRVQRWKDLSPEAVDAVRRVNAVLNVRADDEGGRRATDRLVAGVAHVMGTDSEQPRRLTVPDEYRHWATARARRLVEDLEAGGYPVHGQLADLVPAFTGLPARPRLLGVLDVLLGACLGELTPPARVKEPGSSD